MAFYYVRLDDDLEISTDATSRKSAARILYIVGDSDTGTEGGNRIPCEPEDAFAWAMVNLPLSFMGIPKKRISYDEAISESEHSIEVEYDAPEEDKRDPSGVLINPYISIDTQGKTERKYYSLKTLKSVLPENATGKESDFGGGINVDANGANGVDVVAPNFAWSEKWYFRRGTVSWQYLQSIGEGTGIVNSVVFRGFEKQSVLFLGATFSTDSSAEFDIFTFHFVYNKGGVKKWLEKFDEFDKPGWAYLWVQSKDVVNITEKQTTKKPVQANVEQVYEEVDFGELFKIGNNLPATSNIPLNGNPVIAT